MAYIKLELDHPLEDGETLTFKAPCDCTAATSGVKVYYKNITDSGSTTVNKVLTLKDANNNDVANLGNLFKSGAYVRVIADTTNNYAFIQNANTNAYVETALSSKANKKVPTSAGNIAVLTADGNLGDSKTKFANGTWTPIVAGASSYTKQHGTYFRVGNMVVIQFYVYGTFAGDSTKRITITGCPLSPIYTAGGGGSLSGYTADVNTIFSGWAITSNSVISALGQKIGGSSIKYEATDINQKTSGDFSASGIIAFQVSETIVNPTLNDGNEVKY